MKVGDDIVMVAFGAGFTSGAIALRWTADPARGAIADTIAPDVVRIRPPVDWDSAEAIPPALAAVLGGTVVGDETDLDDIVPGDADAGAAAAEGHGPDGRGSDARGTKVHA